MATKARNRDDRTLVFRSLEEIRKHYQPTRTEEEINLDQPFAGLAQGLSPEAFRRARTRANQND